MRVADWPLRRREVVLVVVEGEVAVDGMLRISALAEDEQDLLVDLYF